MRKEKLLSPSLTVMRMRLVSELSDHFRSSLTDVSCGFGDIIIVVSEFWLSTMCGQHHQDKKKDGNRRQDNIKEKILVPDGRRSITPARFATFIYDHILHMGQVVRHFMSARIAIFGRLVHCAEDDLLHLRGNRGLDLARRRRLLEQTRR